MKKRMLMLTAMTIIAGLFAFCGNAGAADGNKKIRVASQMFYSPSQQQYLREKILPKFKEETGIDVEYVVMMTATDLFKSLEAQSASEKWNTDVLIVHDSAAPTVVSQYDAAKAYDADPAGTYITIFDDNFTKDGKRYFVPLQGDSYYLIANRKALPALEKLGYDINNITWEQFAKWVNALKEETGSPKYVYPSLASKFCIYQTNAIQLACGSTYVPVFNTPESQKAYAILSSMKDAILPSSATMDFPIVPLQSEEAWVSVFLMQYAVDVYSQAPDQFVVAKVPTGDDGAIGTIVGGHGIGIVKQSQNQEAAQAFVDFILRDEILSDIMLLGPFIPSKEELLNSLGDTPKENVMKLGLEMLAGKTRVERVRVGEFTDFGLVKALYETTFNDMMDNKVIDKAYLDQKQKELEALRVQ
jgi:multiple sugar transport system substrate-binding protein